VKKNTISYTANPICCARRLAVGVTLATLLLTGSANLLAQTDRNNQFDIALIGDVPYAPTGVVPLIPSGSATVQTYPSAEYNAMIADINNHNKVAFTVHMGDIKAGNTWCVGGNAKDPAGAANVYTTNLALFNTFSNAAVYLPGDNEWTDCHRTNNGAYNPQERLSYLRGVFYPSSLSLGQKPLALTRQSTTYPENVNWRYGNILFVGINQPGSNNNHQRNISASSPPPTDPNETEYAERNAANIAWINNAFDMATADTNTKAIMIMQQANVFERFLEPNQGYTDSGYADSVNALRARMTAFAKPVVLVGGDTHTVRIDKPLTTLTVTPASGLPFRVGYPGHIGPPIGGAVTPTTMFFTTTGFTCTTPSTTCVVPNRSGIVTPTTMFNTTTGATCTVVSLTCVAPPRVQNFTRIEVFGSPDVAWIRAVVDPFDPNVFSFAMQTIAGNGHGRDGRTDDDDLQ